MEHRAIFNGWCLEQGIFFKKLAPEDLCDLIYWWLIKDMDEKARYRVDVDLTIPPANVIPDENDPMWSEDAEMSFFRK